MDSTCFSTNGESFVASNDEYTGKARSPDAIPSVDIELSLHAARSPDAKPLNTDRSLNADPSPYTDSSPNADPTPNTYPFSYTDSSINADPTPTEFTVEKIIAKRYHVGRLQYLLKWVGYPDTENSWEPMENLSCVGLLAKFENQLYAKKNKGGSSAKQSSSVALPRKKTSSIALYRKREKKRPTNFLFTSSNDTMESAEAHCEASMSSLPSSTSSNQKSRNNTLLQKASKPAMTPVSLYFENRSDSPEQSYETSNEKKRRNSVQTTSRMQEMTSTAANCGPSNSSLSDADQQPSFKIYKSVSQNTHTESLVAKKPSQKQQRPMNYEIIPISKPMTVTTSSLNLDQSLETPTGHSNIPKPCGKFGNMKQHQGSNATRNEPSGTRRRIYYLSSSDSSDNEKVATQSVLDGTPSCNRDKEKSGEGSTKLCALPCVSPSMPLNEIKAQAREWTAKRYADKCSMPVAEQVKRSTLDDFNSTPNTSKAPVSCRLTLDHGARVNAVQRQNVTSNSKTFINQANTDRQTEQDVVAAASQLAQHQRTMSIDVGAMSQRKQHKMQQQKKHKQSSAKNPSLMSSPAIPSRRPRPLTETYGNGIITPPSASTRSQANCIGGNSLDNWDWDWRLQNRCFAKQGLDRCLPMDKVVHSFKIYDETFLFVQWKGCTVPDAVRLTDVIDAYPNLILEYFENLGLSSDC